MNFILSFSVVVAKLTLIPVFFFLVTPTKYSVKVLGSLCTLEATFSLSLETLPFCHIFYFVVMLQFRSLKEKLQEACCLLVIPSHAYKLLKARIIRMGDTRFPHVIFLLLCFSFYYVSCVPYR